VGIVGVEAKFCFGGAADGGGDGASVGGSVTLRWRVETLEVHKVQGLVRVKD